MYALSGGCACVLRQGAPDLLRVGQGCCRIEVHANAVWLCICGWLLQQQACIVEGLEVLELQASL
jgi:hypothetical protein